MLHGKLGLNWQVNIICRSYGKTYGNSWIIDCHNPVEDGIVFCGTLVCQLKSTIQTFFPSIP